VKVELYNEHKELRTQGNRHVILQTGTHFIHPLTLELSAQCALQRTQDLNGCPLVCILLVDYFRWHLFFSASHCVWTEVILWHQKFKGNSWFCLWIITCRRYIWIIDTPLSKLVFCGQLNILFKTGYLLFLVVMCWIFVS